MSTLERKKIIIRLPQPRFDFFLSVRFAVFLALAIFFSVGAYWYQEVRPYLIVPSARLEAFSTTLSSDVSGRIAEMGPAEGDLVKKGQALFSFDIGLLSIKQAQAKAQLERLQEQIEKEKIQIAKVMESYLAATMDQELGAASSETVKKQLALIDESQSKIDEARSQLVAAQTEFEFADLQLKKMKFEAPFDGVILKRFENPGAVVSFGSPVYILCDRDRLWVEAQVPENEIGKISIGTPAKVKFAAYPKQQFSGKVTHISPATVSKSFDAASKEQKEKISLRISINNPAPFLQPGLSAAVSLKVR